jgi:diaminopimelate epimerase
MKLPFIKLQGCGNSFVVVRNDDLSVAGLSIVDKREELARTICEQGNGLGADGFFVISREGVAEETRILVDMRNPDGSFMGMCGNGVRCVVRACFMWGWNDLPNPLTAVIGAHQVLCHTGNEGKTVRVDMGPARFEPEMVPVEADSPLMGDIRMLGGRQRAVWTLSMGNPHCVILDDGEDLQKVGSAIENDPLFPERTNVEMVTISNRHTISVRVWERGAGITKACGTGACASAVMGIERGDCDSPVTVQMPGGELIVEWDRVKNELFLTGPAAEIATGSLFMPSWILPS